MTNPTVYSTIRTALAGHNMPSWQRHLAFALAQSMDERPSASTAKELRVLMADILGDQAVERVGDPVDDIAARRAARRAAAGS